MENRKLRCQNSETPEPINTRFVMHDYVRDVTAHATRSSAIAEGPRDASWQLKSCQLPRNSAETTCTSPVQIDVMKLEV